MAKEAKDLWDEWRKTTIKLYSQVLGFQFDLADYYATTSPSRYVRDVFGTDHWNSRSAEIKAIDETGKSYQNTLAATDSTILDAIKLGQETQENMLSDILRKLKDDEWERKSARLGVWLLEMTNKEMDSLHYKLQANRTWDTSHGVSNPFIKSIAKWLKDGSNTLHWATGVPGVGKSMLISATIDYVNRHLPDFKLDGLAYVYLQWNEQSEQTTRSVYASILYKLRERSIPLSESLDKFYNDHPHHPGPSVEDLQGFLSGLKAQVSQAAPGANVAIPSGRILLIFDGMDEATHDTRRSIIDWMPKLDPTVFRVLVTSRDSFHQTDPALKFQQHHIQAHPGEISSYIKARLHFYCPDIEPESENMRTLVDNITYRSRGIFLRAYLYVEFVANYGSTMKRRTKASEQEFDGLNDMYSAAMQQIRELDTKSLDAMKALVWLTFAKRTLTIGEFEEAVAHEIEYVDEPADPENVVNVDLIVGRCRGLIAVDKKSGLVRLTHQTIWDYLKALPEIVEKHKSLAATVCVMTLKGALQSSTKSVMLPEPQRITEKDDETTESVWGNLYEYLEPSTSRDDSSPSHVFQFHDYAIKFWGAHFQECQDSSGSPVQGLAMDLYRTISPSTWEEYFKFAGNGKDKFEYPSLPDPLTLSCFYGHHYITKRLMTINHAKPGQIGRATYWAALEGHTKCLEVACSSFGHGMDPAFCYDSKHNRSPLAAAAANGRLKCIEFLLSKDIFNVNAQDSKGATALSLAARNSYLDVTATFLSRDSIDINLPDFDGWTPLLWAVRSGSVAVVSRLLSDPRMQLNAVDNKGQNALSLACYYGFRDIVECLVACRDVDLHSQDSAGCTPLIYATKSGDLGVVKALFVRAQNSTSDAILKPNLAAKDCKGRNAISWAAERSDQLLSFLLQHGVNEVCSPDNDGWSPLAWTVQPPGFIKNAILLIPHSKDCINSKDYSGRSVLSSAIVWESLEIADLILKEADAVDVESRDSDGRTALMLAASSTAFMKGLEIVKALVEGKSANSLVIDNSGCTALDWARKTGNHPVADYLEQAIAAKRSDVSP